MVYNIYFKYKTYDDTTDAISTEYICI